MQIIHKLRRKRIQHDPTWLCKVCYDKVWILRDLLKKKKKEQKAREYKRVV